MASSSMAVRLGHTVPSKVCAMSPRTSDDEVDNDELPFRVVILEYKPKGVEVEKSLEAGEGIDNRFDDDTQIKAIANSIDMHLQHATPWKIDSDTSSVTIITMSSHLEISTVDVNLSINTVCRLVTGRKEHIDLAAALFRGLHDKHTGGVERIVCLVPFKYKNVLFACPYDAISPSLMRECQLKTNGEGDVELVTVALTAKANALWGNSVPMMSPAKFKQLFNKKLNTRTTSSPRRAPEVRDSFAVYSNHMFRFFTYLFLFQSSTQVSATDMLDVLVPWAVSNKKMTKFREFLSETGRSAKNNIHTILDEVLARGMDGKESINEFIDEKLAS